jgi:molybdopterin converting factor small subunit
VGEIHLLGRGEPWTWVLGTRVIVATNQELTSLDALVRDEDEVAFFPPLTGA